MREGVRGMDSKGPTRVFQRPMEPGKFFPTGRTTTKRPGIVVRGYPTESTFDFLWRRHDATYYPAMVAGCPKPTRKPVANTRHCARFSLHVPVFFTWKEAKRGAAHDESGVTRDVSVEGLFVTSSECPSKGSDVELVVRLPRLGSDTPPLHIVSSGWVTRVDSDGSHKTGFSVCTRDLIVWDSADFEGSWTN